MATSEEITVQVALGDRSYEIAIGSGSLRQIVRKMNGWLSARESSTTVHRRVLMVTDDNVRDRHARPAASTLSQNGYDCQVISLPPGEGTKSLQSASTLYDALVAMQADRQTVVVAVENRFKHRLYGKVVRRTSRLKAHDEQNACGTGDRVLLMETRPSSKTKRWRVVEILEKAK